MGYCALIVTCARTGCIPHGAWATQESGHMDQNAVTDRPAVRVTLGDLIKRARLDKGWDQARLADTIGVSRQAVGAWERDRSQPDFGIMRRIVWALDAEWLYTERFRGDASTHIGWSSAAVSQGPVRVAA